MKCPKCNTVNKKTDERCKKCNELLHEEKEEMLVIEDKKEEPLKEIEERIVVAHKKKNPLKKVLLALKIIIGLLVISIITLFVYIYVLFDYNKYYEENMNRYYETENKQYLNSIKLLFRVYRLDDNKVSKMQNKGLDIASLWIDELKNGEYSLEEEYSEELNYLERIINSLYTETEYEGHTAISKKTYNSLTFSIKELKTILEESKNENLPELEDPGKITVTEYDISNFISVYVDGVLNLFTQEDLSVLYIGRETCHFCVQYVPIIENVQEELNFKTYYLDITKVDTTSELFTEFIEKLNKKYEMDGQTKEFGEFYGYTPMTVIIKNGKMVDGEIGYMEEVPLKELISKYL